VPVFWSLGYQRANTKTDPHGLVFVFYIAEGITDEQEKNISNSSYLEIIGVIAKMV
jgi:hypothetical protein